MNIEVKSVLELYENHPERWLQGRNARSRYLEIIRPTDERATCWCLYGAILKVYGQNTEQFQLARTMIFATLQFYGIEDDPHALFSIIRYNDAKDRTFDEILNLVKEAGI